jgi:hypothetical protein
MCPRLIISDNRDDPGNPLVLDGEAIEGAASDPAAIGKLMVDQVWAEGADPTGGALYYERNSNEHRRLQAFETGYEELMTGGWVRVLVTPEQLERERAGMEQAASSGLVSQHGTHRGVPRQGRASVSGDQAAVRLSEDPPAGNVQEPLQSKRAGSSLQPVHGAV